MQRTSFRTGAIAMMAAVAAVSSYAAADSVTLEAAGSSLFDGTPAGTPGVTPFVFFDNNQPQVIQSIQSISLNGLTHTYGGDLTVALRFQPINPATPFTDAILFDSINDGSTFEDQGQEFIAIESNDFNGTYSFADNATQTLQTAAGPDDDAAVVPSGTYRASNFYQEGVDAPDLVNLTSLFAGKDLSQGQFLLIVVDNNNGDTGTLGSATLQLTTTVVPEPASIAGLGLAGAAMIRRRK